MSEFAARMITDLLGFSGQLLERGLGQHRLGATPHMKIGTESVLLGAVRGMTELVPSLLDELEDLEDTHNTVQWRCWTATRARLSRAPRDWARSGNRLLPQRWLRTDPSPSPDVQSLSWVLHLLETLDRDLAQVRQRTGRYVQEARASRRGTSKWASYDLVQLEGLEHALEFARITLARATRSVFRRADGKLRARVLAPSPFPRGRAWSRVRQLASDIANKERTLTERIAALLSVAPEIADEPVLYQRWCGMRIIEGLDGLGWKAEGDFIGALYLAGHVMFRKDSSLIDLWIESRITRHAHPSGFVCVRGEDATPDYLIVTPGAGGLDAFVLDATRSTDEDVLEDKRRYLDILQGIAPAMLAGVISGPRRPMRSWAGAPFDLGHCRLATQNGSAGVVPMHPIAWNPAPLSAWLSDIDRHARAWSG